MGKPIVIGLGVVWVLFVAALVLSWGTALTHILNLSSALLFPLSLLALIYAGIDFLVSTRSGPRTVTIDWSTRRLSEEAKGRTTVHDLAALRGFELWRVESTGESSPSSYHCKLVAGFVDAAGTTLAAEILATGAVDDADSAYASLHPLAAELAASLGTTITVKDERV